MSVPIVRGNLVLEAQLSHSHRLVIHCGLVLHLVIVLKLLNKKLGSDKFLRSRQIVVIWRDVPLFMSLSSVFLFSNDTLSLGRTLFLAFYHLVGNCGFLELFVSSLLMLVTR